MKIKIPNFIDDYVTEWKKYYKKIRKYIKKIYRKSKYFWFHPKSKFAKRIIPIINLIILKIIARIKNFKENIKHYYKIFKYKFLKSNTKKRKLAIICSIIIINLLIFKLLPSFAIYQDRFEFSVLGGKIGNKLLNEYDYTLLIYIEDEEADGSSSGKYNLIREIPAFGYVYSGYKCINDSKLEFDEEIKFTTVTLEQKDVCSVYFNLSQNSDITLNVMIEDKVNSNNYLKTNNIPYFGYKYSHYECTNGSVLNYNSELHKASIETNKKDTCNIYFKKEPSDIEVILYVENSRGEYIESVTIPHGNNYKLNNDKSDCFNNNEERVNAEISYTYGYIGVATNEITYCKVYLDLNNE